MKRLLAVALAAVCILPDGWAARKKQAELPKSDREVWAETAYKIAYPVLSNLAAGTLHANMPIEQRGPSHPEYGAYGDRTKYADLEAWGRTICGIAPWLELPVDTTTRDGKMRKELLDLSIRGLRNAMDTTSADYISFAVGYQALVDAALNYMDRAATGITVEMITGDVNAFLRNLIGQGAIVEGECTWDETKNPAVEIAQGRLTFTLSVRYAPSLESLTFEEVVEL